MNKTLSEDTIKYMISRIIDYANDAVKEAEEEPDDLFYKGKKLAYIEMLNVLKSELAANDADLKKFGIEFDVNNLNLQKKESK